MTRGLIFNVQRFSLHDGPGIRTTVFFKGCPLRCSWCQNPEGLSVDRVIIQHKQKCLLCCACVRNCHGKAINPSPTGPVINRTICLSCFRCAINCPAGALEVAGREVTTAELTAELLKDEIIFEESGGGVTFSGGEPFLQPLFLFAMLTKLNEKGIHLAIETCGHTSWANLEQAIPITDLFLFDLKFVDEEKHTHYTGVSGRLILSNLERLVKEECNLIVRMPLVPGINNDKRSIDLAAVYLKNIGVKKIELLTYHSFGESKYEKIGKTYGLTGLGCVSNKDYERAKTQFNEYGLEIIGGGK